MLLIRLEMCSSRRSSASGVRAAGLAINISDQQGGRRLQSADVQSLSVIKHLIGQYGMLISDDLLWIRLGYDYVRFFLHLVFRYLFVMGEREPFLVFCCLILLIYLWFDRHQMLALFDTRRYVILIMV